jgi:tetratricopeptide (TPR) repeat protein
LLWASSARLAHADAPAPAAAEVAVSEPADYRETVEEAVQEFSAQHYEESRSLFWRAHVLFPNARTHRGLGLAEFELRNYGECIKQFEAALRSDIKPLSPELRGETEKMLARANHFVARIVVDAKPGPSTVLVDDQTLELPAGQAIVLQMGRHTLEVRAHGFLPDKRQLNIQGGEEETLTIILSQNQPAASEPLARPNDAAARRWYKSPWLWAGVGLVVAGAAAGTGYALARDPKEPSPYGGDRHTVLSGP